MCLPLFLSLALAACSGPMTPPGSIDDETTVSSIDRVDTTHSAPSTYPAPDSAVQETTDSTDYLDTPNLANRESQPLPKIDEEPLPRFRRTASISIRRSASSSRRALRKKSPSISLRAMPPSRSSMASARTI